jgi:hypothetical protein
MIRPLGVVALGSVGLKEYQERMAVHVEPSVARALSCARVPIEEFMARLFLGVAPPRSRHLLAFGEI